ncbi:MAG: DUF3168 domain-containing protein [Roseitalea porphyridii]|uniref:DUF3168 domain-containing protein n=1 Tax=Roseitalea porphyridii TaxID=1852022 RepID=UPI0032D909CB
MIDDLHLWLFGLLSADAALIAELGDPPSIFDRPPPRRALPAVYLGRIEASDWSTDDGPGQAFIATIHVYARGANRSGLYPIADRIGALITGATPATAGGARIVLATQLTATYAHERAQSAFRGTLRLRFLCEPAA